jgi:hypothetical protein
MIDGILLIPAMAWLPDKQLDTYTRESMATGDGSGDSFAQISRCLKRHLDKREHFSSDFDL